MSTLEITIALDRYDRHFPFFDGTVKAPAGLRYNVLQVGQTDLLRDGVDRHDRMIHDQAFDVAEFSMSTFLMAIDRGLPLIGIPVFPRRLFSQSCMFVRADSSIAHPRDLVDRRVGLASFQTTLSLLAKGDLKFEYGVEWERIRWLVTTDEKVSFQTKNGVVIDRAAKGTDLGEALGRGEIDALFMPHPPLSIMNGQVAARRLFQFPQAEEERYYKKYGWWPIMHVVAMRPELVAQSPSLPAALMDMFAQAHTICRSYYNDPNWSRVPWARYAYEASSEIFRDPWVNGLSSNKANLEQLIMYSHDQGLIKEPFPAERLFAASTLDT